jgi:hypothetical protein
LGRIFGKKDKQLKSMKDPHGSPYVTMPLSNSPSGGFAPPSVHPMAQHPSNMYVGECDMSSSESMGTGLGGLAGKGDFDRRKKKRFFLDFRFCLNLDQGLLYFQPFYNQQNDFLN